MKKTNILLLLCLFSSIIVLFLEPSHLDYLTFSKNNLKEGRFWTLITALFIHNDALHLFGNLIFLYVFGNTLEDLIGSKKMLSAFFIGGVLSFLISTYFYPPDIPMIGASAAIFTLAAVAMLVKPLRISILFIFLPVGLVAILYFIFNLYALEHADSSNVAYISHIIGFMIGIPLGMSWSKEWAKNLIITILLLLIYFILAYWLLPILFISYGI